MWFLLHLLCQLQESAWINRLVEHIWYHPWLNRQRTADYSQTNADFMFAFPSVDKKQAVCQGQSLRIFPHTSFVHFQPNVYSYLLWTPTFRGDMNLITDHECKIKNWDLNKAGNHLGTLYTAVLFYQLWKD